MGIKAQDMKIELANTRISVTKHMLSDPRRIGRIDVVLEFPAGLQLDEKDRLILERVGDNCPVIKSLHPICRPTCGTSGVNGILSVAGGRPPRNRGNAWHHNTRFN